MDMSKQKHKRVNDPSTDEYKASECAFKNGGFIAGSYAAYLAGDVDSFGDVDFFFPDMLSLKKSLLDFYNLRRSCKWDFNHVSGYVQIRNVSYNYVVFGNPNEVCNSFDLGISKTVLLDSINSNQLFTYYIHKWNFSPKIDTPEKTARRILKYIDRVPKKDVDEMCRLYGRFINTYGSEAFFAEYDPRETDYGMVTEGRNEEVQNFIEHIRTFTPVNRVKFFNGQYIEIDIPEEEKATHENIFNPQKPKCEHLNVKTYVGFFTSDKYCEDCGKVLCQLGDKT